MIVALLLLSLSSAAPPEQEFAHGVTARGNARTAREAFARAAAGFDEAWRQSPTPERAAARGRAHFLAGDVSHSLAAVHAGLALAPYDAELQADLRGVRSTIRYPEPTAPALRVRPFEPSGLRSRVSPWDAFTAAGLCGLVAVVGSVLALTTRPRGAVIAAMVGWVGVAACGLLAWRIATERPPAVAILSADTVLRRGNGVSYPPRLTEVLPRGAELRPVGERGGWVQVELPGGAVGWVERTKVLSAIPADGSASPS